MLTVAVLFAVVHPVSKNRGLMSLAKYAFGKKSKFTVITILRMLIPGMAVSVFLNNTPIIALFIPLIKDWCRENHEYPSKYLMIMNFGVSKC
jgi:Na+/H+ antiporter NhaD/arsenite permease-like protein